MKQKEYKVEIYAFPKSVSKAEKIVQDVIPLDDDGQNKEWNIAEEITVAASAGRWFRIGRTTFNPLDFSAIEVHVSEACWNL